MSMPLHSSESETHGIERFGVYQPRQRAAADPDQLNRPVDDSSHVVTFGPFRLDRSNAILTRDHQRLALTPKAFALLCFLVDSAGQLLTKDVIFSKVWPKLIVSDAALSVCIGELRKVLGDSTKTPRYIETVHKRGFRFIGPVAGCPDRRHDGRSPSIIQPPSPIVVGREQSLSRLNQCQDKASRGVRQFVFMSGEAGIGKTTLAETFLNQDIFPDDAWFAKGQCLEHYGIGEAYFPLLDALGGLARKGAAEIADILARNAPTCLEHLPALKCSANILSSNRSPAFACPERMLREIAGALEVLSSRRLLILILEDLHWSDSATIDLLSFLARRTTPARLMVIGTYRHAYAAVQSHPVKTLNHDLQLRRQCESIHLEFLDQNHIAGYLSRIFPSHDFPADFPALIQQQSSGNPLFMINLLNYLQQNRLIQELDGRWRLMPNYSSRNRPVPGDIERMINRQIDQLDPECRMMLEAASIASEPGGIAVQFTLTEVAAAIEADELHVEHCLDRLARHSHFLHTLGVMEWPDGTYSSCFEFTHALYQNVLYRRVGTVRKIRLHHRLGLTLEQGYLNRSTEIAGKLAVHFEVGRDYDRALRYLYATAETSAKRGANREALHSVAKAQQLLAKLPDSTSRDRMELSLLLLQAAAITASQGNASPEIVDCYLRADELCERLNEPSERFRVQFGLRSFYVVHGNLDKANRLARSLLNLAETQDDPELLLEAHVGLASSEFFSGNQQASHRHALQGIALYDKDKHAGHAARYGMDPGVFCYARAGQTAWALGYPDQALDHVRQATQLANAIDHPYSLVFAIHNRTLILLYRRDAEAALASARQGKQLSMTHGFSFLLAWALHLSAWAYALAGDSNRAGQDIEKALAAERPASLATDSYLSLFLAEAYRLLGDFEKGLHCLKSPCEVRSFETESLYLQAELILMRKDSASSIGRAESLLKEVLALSRRHNLRGYQLRAAVPLAGMLLRQKRFQESHACLIEARSRFTEGFKTSEYLEATRLMATLRPWLTNRPARQTPSAELEQSLQT
ncbi:MAG: ATP-binding protein [Gammaproteobacteria bacterium]